MQVNFFVFIFIYTLLQDKRRKQNYRIFIDSDENLPISISVDYNELSVSIFMRLQLITCGKVCILEVFNSYMISELHV